MFAEESPDWNPDASSSVECELCGEEPATMHLIRVVEGRVSHTHLCPRCAENLAEQTEGLALVLALPTVLRGAKARAETPAFSTSKSREEKLCPVCGTTSSDLRESGLVGCGNCYQVFGEQLEVMVKRDVEMIEHMGKVPLRGPETDSLRHEIMRLERMLRELVAHERYEEAAGVRDRLTELGQRLQGDDE